MQRATLRTAGLSLAICASLAFGGIALAETASATKSAVETEAAATSSEVTESIASTNERQITIAEGLSEEDAAAVAQGMTVRIIDQYYSNLADAVELANQNGGGTIALLADTVATDDIEKVATIGFRTSIMIKSEGDVPLTVYRSEGQVGPMLALTDGTVSLKNISFDGSGEGVGSPVITISDQAVVKFGKNMTITTNSSDGSISGAKLAASAVSVSGSDAELTLKEGCVISGNTATGAAVAAVYNDGATVINEGATFENNTAETSDNPNYAGTGKLKGTEIDA